MAAQRQSSRSFLSLKCIIFVLMVIAGFNIISDLQFNSTATDLVQSPDPGGSSDKSLPQTTSPVDGQVDHSVLTVNDSNRDRAVHRGPKYTDPFWADNRSEISLFAKTPPSADNVLRLTPFPALYISDSPHWLSLSLVVMGQLKDCDRHLERVLAALESVACLFGSARFVLFESNSADRTSLFLEQFALRSANCSERAFNPRTVARFGGMHSVEDLLAFFDDVDGAEFVDELIVSALSNVTNLDDLDLLDLHWSLHEALWAESNGKLRALEIEELLHRKMEPIQFVKYRHRIAVHQGDVQRIVIRGDDVVADALETEREILRQIRVYDGVNEFHSGSQRDRQYGKLARVRSVEGHRGEFSDFEVEFDGIHQELEGLMADDAELVHQSLRDKQLEFARKRKELRAQRLAAKQQRLPIDTEPDGDDAVDALQKDDGDDAAEQELEARRREEFYYDFRDRLYRVERSVAFLKVGFLFHAHSLCALCCFCFVGNGGASS